MYSFPNLEPACCSMSGLNCCFLTCIQVSQEGGKVFLNLRIFHNLLWSTQSIKGFSIVSEADVDAFLEFACFLYDPANVGNLISASSAFSKSSLYIWNFSVYILLKPNVKDFANYLASMWSEHNFTVVWTFFGIVLLWGWMKTLSPVLCSLLSFPNLTYWVQHFNSIIF